MPFIQKIERFWHQSGLDAFETQNIFQNVLGWAKWYWKIISEISNCQTTIFKYQIFQFSDVSLVGRCWRSSRPRFVFNLFPALFELVVPLINVFLWHSLVTKGLPQHFERVRTRVFVPQTKFDASSLLNKITHCRNRKIYFWLFIKTRVIKR